MNDTLILPTNITCGYFDCITFFPLKVSPKRICTSFEIEYFLENGKNTFSNGISYPIRQNWVYICVPGEERYSELPFKTKFLKFHAKGKLAQTLMNAPRYFHVSQPLEAIALLDEIITINTMQGWDDILLYGKVLTYISLLLENAYHSKQVNTYKNELITKAQDFIKEHCGENIKLHDIAKIVNLSPNYFHTLFSEICGITPREYLEKHRINMAKKLLLTTQFTLREIAEQCGFNTQQYLTTIFNTKVGCSPTEFKRQHQNIYLI